MIFFITFTDMLYYCIQTCIMMCYCILQLWLSSQGHSLLFIYFFVIVLFFCTCLAIVKFRAQSSYTVLLMLKSVCIYHICAAGIMVLLLGFDCFLFVFPVLIDFYFNFRFLCIISQKKRKD